ncbi:MAG: alpha/beta hydrolase-fold protein [Candidatus Zixiibacteriota bacterium]
MRSVIFIAILAGLFTLAMVTGCSDRGTNAPLVSDPDVWNYNDNAKQVFSPQLRFQIRNPEELLLMAVYTPKISWPPSYGGENKKVPLLILLPPQDGDQFYYFNHGLYNLVEEMIAKKEIRPMAIATISNDRVFGGYFYGNSYPAGFYDSIFGDTYNSLIDWLLSDYPMILPQASQHAIGGIGMGAYGAFRAAIKHPGVYSAISVLDGPMDFDGPTGTGGLMNLFDSVIAEQGLIPDSFKVGLDTSRVQPVSRMFIGGSLAFSPTDTLVDYDITADTNADGDTLEVHINFVNRYQWTTDSTTMITELIDASGLSPNDNTGFDFMLPFDSIGNPHAPVWNLWLDNNLEKLNNGNPGLTGVAMWFGTTPEADHGFYDQTQSWISYLRGLGYTPEVKEYRGTPDKPAREGEYVYDLMREMLIFHSKNFGN